MTFGCDIVTTAKKMVNNEQIGIAIRIVDKLVHAQLKTKDKVVDQNFFLSKIFVTVFIVKDSFCFIGHTDIGNTQDSHIFEKSTKNGN